MPAPTKSETPEVKPKAESAEAPTPAMTTEQLLALVVNMQQQLATLVANQSASSEKQTEAILELALKTQKQVAEELNEKQFKDQQKQQEAIAKANQKWAHENCDHIAGCNALGETANVAGLTAIIWHRGDVGQTTGICTVCQRIFKQTDPDFYQWRKKKSFNRESASGLRTVPDPLKAIELSYLHDID